MSTENKTFTERLRGLYSYLRFKLRLPRDSENMHTTISAVRSGAELSGSNLWVLVAAIFTASLGLNVNSTAVIIGAMLISPLMGPIMGMGMGLAIQDFTLAYRSVKNFAIAVGLSLLTSTVYFLISPLKVPGSELLARTSPTIYDVLIATFGGIAGIVAGASNLRQSNVIPGVAIATALMPPLCTAGFGLANLNFYYFIGAAYLFFINTVFISLSTYAVVRLLNYPVQQVVLSRQALRIRTFLWTLVLIAIIPSAYLTFQIVKRYLAEERAKSFVKAQQFNRKGRVLLQSQTDMEQGRPVIRLTVLGPTIDSAEYNAMVSDMPRYGLEKGRLIINQGLEDSSRNARLLGTVASAIEGNSEAVRNLYARIDSLERQLHPLGITDSMQRKLLQEARTWLPALDMMELAEKAMYRASGDSTIRMLRAVCYFSRPVPAGDLLKLKGWLQNRTGADTVMVTRP